jgi:hypothetical protein
VVLNLEQKRQEEHPWEARLRLGHADWSGQLSRRERAKSTRFRFARQVHAGRRRVEISMEIRPHVLVLIALLPSWAPCPNQLRGEYSECRSNLPGIDFLDLR